MYESLDVVEYNDIPLDYTYPTPSPTAKYDPERETAYTYIPNDGSTVPSLNEKTDPTLKSNGVNGNSRNIYHSIGPDALQHYEFENPNGHTAGGGGGHVIRKGSEVGHDHHYLNTQFGNSSGVVVYEDPTLPKFRVREIY